MFLVFFTISNAVLIQINQSLIWKFMSLKIFETSENQMLC